MMPKPQHPYTARVEATRSLIIAGAPWRGVVLGSIDLNHQSHCGAIAIQYEAFDGVLPPKSATVQLCTTEALPKALLRVGHMLAQVTRSVQEGRWDWGGIPCVLSSPLPTSPRWGEVSETAFSKTLMAFLICDNV